MKKIIFILLLAFGVSIGVNAQSENYIRVSGDIGLVVNSERDEKFGVGGTIAWLTTDNLISYNENIFITLAIKGFNNPYGEGKIISSINNDENDGFTYLMPLIGYRITQKGVSDGFFVEPRLGAAFGSGYSAFTFAPLAGFSLKNFDLSVYCDMGFGSKTSAIATKNFFTPGVSIAYSFGL